jgi:hypothetical protein
MNVIQACTHILTQLSNLVSAIRPEDFSRPSETLNKSTIGQHLRHTLEFFICLEAGCSSGTVNYDRRSHDKLIETDKFLAMAAIEHILSFVHAAKGERSLMLEAAYGLEDGQEVAVQTNLTRELVYNIEHAVHHMAIMKIGIKEVAPYISLPKDFGVAASTLRHQTSAATSSHKR